MIKVADSEKQKVGAAILGFYGAIKCCLHDGLDPDQVYQLVKNFVETGRIGDGTDTNDQA
jgi:hypothetical protein